MTRLRIPDAASLLTPKQLAFIERYLVHFNATQAAKEAGYSAKSARQTGCELLQHPAVQFALSARRREVREQASVDRERVLLELSRIAFADIRLLYDANGALLPPRDWPDDIAAAVSGLDTTELLSDGSGGVTRKVRLADKLGALDKLARHLGLYEADHQQSGQGVVESMRALIAAAHGTAIRPGLVIPDDDD
ncbi:terminase small subunit [Crenobacter cavernae]|nr:terminase small subunit [Crenobacter cavernae]